MSDRLYRGVEGVGGGDERRRRHVICSLIYRHVIDEYAGRAWILRQVRVRIR